MDIYTLSEIAAEKRQAKITAISDAIGELEQHLTYDADCSLDELVRVGAFASLWGSSAARNALCVRMARAALTVALTDPACDLPDEVRHLFREYLEGAQ